MRIDALFAALADPTRRSLFETLAREPGSVGELAARLPVTRAAVSQHLKQLLGAGLVEVEAQGRRRLYRVRREGLDALSSYARNPAGIRTDTRPASVDDPIANELTKWEAEAPHIDHGILALLMYFTQIGQYMFTSNEEVAAQLGLGFSDVTLLGALRRLGPPYESTPTQLSRTFWITLPGMTKRLSKLAAMGLLQRKASPDDGRSVLLRLTPKGLDTLRELVAHHQPAEYYALQGLDAGERQQLLKLLGRLLEQINRLHGRRPPPYVIR
ncbi:MAG: MarR family transcriptional regulator [Hydrocarboniphaga sp.]|uniref:metalloregulator ArsR/SmtB family transcription factor n=1 Tax=Hydrocarboniphaga sp. TaxID=2033016 RepID=UPI0026078DA9|nr:metalloregulator ArsR/SmtB family transcription factor [Hydrocarboniphaga sp.]MDB5967998.1 MarR family transcriptional regulator [Hydrocarboniphaga sp.]